MTERGAFTIAEAAEYAAVSVTTIRRAYRSGALELIYPTSKPVIRKAALDEWLASLPTEPKAS